jgi:hypothetical protein
MMPQERPGFKGTNVTATIHQNRTRLTITSLKTKICNRLTIDMKRTKRYHKITHPTDIISVPTPRKRGPHNAEATDATKGRNRGYT